MILLKKLSLLTLCIFWKYASSSSNKVPLLMWTNVKGDSCFKSLNSFEETVTSLFTNDFINCLSKSEPENVIVFVYDQLGIEDITRYGQTNSQNSGSFFNLETLVEQHMSLMIPSMEPSNIVEDIFGKLDKISKNIKMVRLSPFDRTDSMSTAKGFKQADDQILDNINAIEGKYIAVVTSESPPTDQKLRYTRDTGRRLLATEEDESRLSYLVSDCVLMTFESVNISVTQIASKKTFSSALVLNNSSSANFSQVRCLPSNESIGNERVTIDFTATTQPFLTAQIEMVFHKNFSGMTYRYWWKLAAAYVSYTTNSTALTGQDRLPLNPFLFENVVTAPAEFSFVCANTTGLTFVDVTRKTTQHNDTVYIQFNGFQVQPFVSNASKSFSEASDCVGWYTAPIWSGLIVSFLLVLILTYGISMMSYITTMDRFDDPKGKTMTVPQEST